METIAFGVRLILKDGIFDIEVGRIAFVFQLEEDLTRQKTVNIEVHEKNIHLTGTQPWFWFNRLIVNHRHSQSNHNLTSILTFSNQFQSYLSQTNFKRDRLFWCSYTSEVTIAETKKEKKQETDSYTWWTGLWYKRDRSNTRLQNREYVTQGRKKFGH